MLPVRLMRNEATNGAVHTSPAHPVPERSEYESPERTHKKATAKTANVASSEATVFSEGKNCVTIMVAK